MVCRHSAAANRVRGAASATANHGAASAAALSLAASRRRLTQISFTTVSSLVVKLRRGAGARTCLQSSFLMFCEHYNAKLLLLNKKTLLRKTTDFTQKQQELRKTIKNSRTMKSRKHNDGITHINNSLAGRLIQGALPGQCLTAGAATLPSIRNGFLQTLFNLYADITQHYAEIPHIFLKFTQNTLQNLYGDITQI